MEEFVAHFAQEEAVFKEQVAEEIERLAEKKVELSVEIHHSIFCCHT